MRCEMLRAISKLKSEDIDSSTSGQSLAWALPPEGGPPLPHYLPTFAARDRSDRGQTSFDSVQHPRPQKAAVTPTAAMTQPPTQAFQSGAWSGSTQIQIRTWQQR